MSFSGDQTQLEDCPVTSGDDRASCCGQTMTPNADQTCHGHQETALNSDQNVYRDEMRTLLSGDRRLCRSQMTSPSDELLTYGARTMAPDANQTFFGGQMTPTCALTKGVQTAFPTSNQTIFGGQMTPTSALTKGVQATLRTSNQTIFGGQMTPTSDSMDGVQLTLPIGNQIFFGSQMTPTSGHQASYRTQMMPCEGNQSLYRSQKITPSVDQAQMAALDGDQTLHGVQMTNPSGDQIFYDPQMANPRGGQTHYTGQVMSLVALIRSQLHFQDRSPSTSNSRVAQEQLPECSSSFPLAPRHFPVMTENLGTWASKLQKRNNWKTYNCKQCGQLFLRTSHLQNHLRSKHNGDKPYRCRMPKCQWKFASLAELRQHMKMHFEGPSSS
uniref:Kruppel-like factor 18 n=1 Tax=Myodes glareolus TaxID=447135 RepID=UPI0020213491|nr:Kruppel-like factor 18 [Myodes glareolus]